MINHQKQQNKKQTDVAAGAIYVLSDVTEIFMSPWKNPSSIFYQANLIIHCISWGGGSQMTVRILQLWREEKKLMKLLSPV